MLTSQQHLPLLYQRQYFVAYSLALFCLFFIQGCSSNKPFVPLSTKAISHQVNADNVSLSNIQQLRQTQLIALYSQWQGTPYRLGGSNRKGIDCSSFVQQVYQDGFGVLLPRATNAQVNLGHPVNENFTVGDLVFFKTKPKVRHVGIYLGNNQFMHASTSQGVTISKLSNIYWSKHYWQTRRILTGENSTFSPKNNT